MTDHIPPALLTIINRKAKLRSNSGMDVDELTFAPCQIGADEVSVEDGGQAVIVEINPDRDSDNGLFVRLHSWDAKMQHQLIRGFIGKRVEITIKVVDANLAR